MSFIFNDGDHSLILMSSGGQLYLQPMDVTSSAVNGPFYLTNVVPIEHADLQDSNGQIAGGGVSVYYSHILQLLFFSYSQGNYLRGKKEIAIFNVSFSWLVKFHDFKKNKVLKIS